MEYFEVANTVSSLVATVSRLEARLETVATVSRLEATTQALNMRMDAGGNAAAVANDMASRTMGLMSSATANQVRRLFPPLSSL